MRAASILVWTLILYYCSFGVCDKAKTLRLLVVVPFPDSNGTNGWDRGLELLPAVRVATKEINNDQYILPGYKIELIERAEDACGVTVATTGLSNVINAAINPEISTNAMAILGMACSTNTRSISPIAGRNEVSLLQMSMSNSNILSDLEKFPNLWRFLGSSDQYVFALEKLMDRLSWTRVGLVFDSGGAFFNGIATTFRNVIEARKYTLLVDQGIQSTSDSVGAALNLIRSFGVRVIFCPTTIPESVEILCQAAKQKLVWPGYVWIFPSRHYQDFQSSIKCDRHDLLLQALENVLLIDFVIVNNNDSSELLTGSTYGEYLAKYNEEAEVLMNEPRFSEYLRYFDFTYGNAFANFMYNELWAFALALNQSLPEITSSGFVLDEYQYNHSNITKIIEKHLMNVSFQGTVGRVKFTANRVVPTLVSLYQIKNGSEFEFGTVLDQELSFNEEVIATFPNDNFEEKYNLLNTGIAVVIYIQAVLLIFFITFLLCLMILLQKEPEVRASSPLLSMHIFIGCYMLAIASLFLTTRQYILLSETEYQIFCYIGDILTTTGINFIAASVLLRLARVYRIFTKLNKISWAWKNKPLFVVTIIICVLPILITFIEIGAVPKQLTKDITLKLNSNPPIMETSIRCYSRYGGIFELIVILYTILLILALLALAVLTRNINKKHFNDTKKVAAFVFIFTLFGTVFITVTYILRSLRNDNDSVVLLSYMNHFMILMSQLFLVLPKVIPTFYYRYIKKEERSVYENPNDDDATISMFVFRPIAKLLNAVFVTSNNSKSDTTSNPTVYF